MSDRRVRAVTNHIGHVNSLYLRVDETVSAAPRETISVILRPTHYKRLMYVLGAGGTETQRDFQRKYGAIAAHIFAFSEGDVSDLEVWLGSNLTLGPYIISRRCGVRNTNWRMYAAASTHTFMNSPVKFIKGSPGEVDSVFSARVKVLVDGELSKRVVE